jgi:hypothetical protein
MFLTHWATPDRIYVGADKRLGETEHLWRNESDESGIRFVNVSEETRMSEVVLLTRTYPGTYDFPFSAQEFDFTFTPTFARINDDLWPDIAIAADFGTTQLAVNNGDGVCRRPESLIVIAEPDTDGDVLISQCPG